MTFLYLCRTDGDQYRMVKMTSLSEVESSYLCSETRCECPAGVWPTCRHREMIPKFIHRGAINTGWGFDYDRGGWVQTEYGSTDDAPINYVYREEDCPGHVASDHDQKVCGRCGVHIDSLRPDDEPMPPLPAGVVMIGLDDPREVHNAIANAVGEPELPAPTKPKALFIRRRI